MELPQTNLTHDTESSKVVAKRGVKHPELIKNVTKLFKSASGELAHLYVVYQVEIV